MSSSKHDLKHLIAFSYFSKFGFVRLNKIKNFFSNWQNAWHAKAQDFIQAGIEENIVQEFMAFKINIDLDKILNILHKEDIKILSIDDDDYPQLLKEIYNPPFILYYRGNIKISNQFNFAVVGTRKYTNYGRQVVENIVQDLVKNNLVIVSGLALGIDTFAHLTSLENKGSTIAVLGSGLDKESIYPRSNYFLAEKIVSAESLLISEFPPGTKPLRYYFPQRNRIISGLSLGTLVIEAAQRSGALITAHLALEQNREVFAIPGSIYSSSSLGPNNLIKEGAHLVNNAQDIIEVLNLTQATSYIKNQEIIVDSKEEELILSFLSREPIHIDVLVRQAKLDTAIVNSTLTIMEMKGMVRNLGGMMYVLVR